MKKSGIYQIVNETNGKYYIGSSKDIKNRWRQWRNSFKKEMKYKSPLQMAVRKYGIENFTFIIIEECKPTKEILEIRENYYFETLKPEYNILKKAYSNVGYNHTTEAKEKIRRANVGKTLSNDTRQKIRTANIGKKFSDITKQKLRTAWAVNPKRKSNLGKKFSDDTKEKLRMSNLGKKLSDITKKKIGLAQIGRKVSDITKEKLRLAQTGKKHSIATKEKMKLAHIGKKKKDNIYEKNDNTRN